MDTNELMNDGVRLLHVPVLLSLLVCISAQKQNMCFQSLHLGRTFSPEAGEASGSLSLSGCRSSAQFVCPEQSLTVPGVWGKPGGLTLPSPTALGSTAPPLSPAWLKCLTVTLLGGKGAKGVNQNPPNTPALSCQAIGARNLLKSIAKQREAQEQQLQALIAEKKMQLER